MNGESILKKLTFRIFKNYDPKRQFLEYSFSIHYGVKFKYLTTCKIVSIEIPTQHFFFEQLGLGGTNVGKMLSSGSMPAIVF